MVMVCLTPSSSARPATSCSVPGGRARPAVLVTDSSTGDVSVVLNRGLPPGQVGFAEQERYHAGPSLDPGGNLVFGTLNSGVDFITNRSMDAQLARMGLTPAAVAGFL